MDISVASYLLPTSKSSGVLTKLDQVANPWPGNILQARPHFYGFQIGEEWIQMSCHLDSTFLCLFSGWVSAPYGQNLQFVVKAFARRGIEGWDGRSIQSNVQMTQFRTIIFKVNKDINDCLRGSLKVLSFGHDITRRLTSASIFSILQPIMKNVRISWRVVNIINDFESAYRRVDSAVETEPIPRVFRDCDHLEAIIAMEGAKISSSSRSCLKRTWLRTG